VPRQPHLAEVPLPQRPPHLVLPHPHCSLRSLHAGAHRSRVRARAARLAGSSGGARRTERSGVRSGTRACVRGGLAS
jgi:hypothetical protein